MSILKALLAVGQDTKVPFGILCADRHLTEVTEGTVDLDRRTVGEAISIITAGLPEITFRAEGGVVVIELKPLPAQCAFTDLVIPEFIVQRDSLEHISAKLWMTLEAQLDHTRPSFAGVLHPSVLDRQIGPGHLRGRRVSDILNWMIQQHSEAAWISYPCKDVQAATNDQLWTIVFYSP